MPSSSGFRAQSLAALAVFCVFALGVAAEAQQQAAPSNIPSAATPAPTTAPTASPPPAEIHITPLARDDEIQRRLDKIFNVTGLFDNLRVDVKDGVVFLTGQTQLDGDKAWAGDLSRNTQDVVAVVNHIDVVQPSA